MTVTWLGQAGLLIETPSATLIVDPYLSDSVGAVNPAMHRRVPADTRFLDLAPDLLLFTHDHLDHYDPETADIYLDRAGAMTVLCPASVWQKARTHGGGKNYVQLDAGSRWTERGLRITAIPAAHSDDHAVGFFLEELETGRKLYITGDTLYCAAIPAALPASPDVVFLPINGVGNNMNVTDAADLARCIGARYAVPLHWGLFDALDPHSFDFAGRIIPAFFAPIAIPE